MTRKMTSAVKTRVLGSGMLLLQDVCWVLAEAAVQLLTRTIPDFQLGVLRYIGTMLCAAVPMCCTNRTDFVVQRESYVHVLLMGVATMACNCFHFFAVATIPLSHVSLEYVFIMIILTVISKVVFYQTHNIVISFCILGCVLGTLFLVQPWLDFTHGFIQGFIPSTENLNITSQNSSTMHQAVASSPTWWLVLGYLSLFGAAIFQSSYAILSGVYLKSVNPAFLTFLTSGVALPLCLACSFYLEQPVWITDPYTILLVSVHVVGTGMALLCEVAGYQMLSPMHATMISNLIPVMSLVLQYTVMTDHLYGRRNALEVAGCIITVVFVTLSGFFNNEEKHEDF